jgi:hypothetical protein
VGGTGTECDHPCALGSKANQALPFCSWSCDFRRAVVDTAGPSRLLFVPDDIRLRPKLEGGSRWIRSEKRLDDAAWEKTSAFEHSLRTRTAALQSQGRDMPDENIAMTYIYRHSSRRRRCLRDKEYTALVTILERASA